jgi:hypothetical protein
MSNKDKQPDVTQDGAVELTEDALDTAQGGGFSGPPIKKLPDTNFDWGKIAGTTDIKP